MAQQHDKALLHGKSPEVRRLNRSVRALANRDEHVLIVGEAGSGRTYVAEILHRIGVRAEKPFIAIECGAIGDTISPEDIFGSDGGQLYAAAEGTIHLKGIERLEGPLQDKLVNFLAAGTGVTRIVSSAEPVLEKLARKKQFRGDLLQKLNELRISMPSLRERKQDIPYLFNHFLESFCQEFGKPVPAIPYNIFEAIVEYDWPGNVAELRNCVRNLSMMSPEGELSPAYLPFQVQVNPLEVLAGQDLSSAVAEVERFLIRRSLTKYDGNQSKAARELKISEAALRYKMKKYGLPGH
jgi:DNA-binding NtrC family response regulator